MAELMEAKGSAGAAGKHSRKRMLVILLTPAPPNGHLQQGMHLFAVSIGMKELI